MNACPPAYRNLSPKAECALRSKRLGTQERPGALPHLINKDQTQAYTAQRRQTLRAMIGDGTTTTLRLRKALISPSWLDYTLDGMLRDGEVTYSAVTGRYALAGPYRDVLQMVGVQG